MIPCCQRLRRSCAARLLRLGRPHTQCLLEPLPRHGALSLKIGMKLLMASRWFCTMHSQIHTRLRTSCSLSFTYA